MRSFQRLGSMIRFWPLSVLLVAAGCVSYPYETAFSACDAEAGACYRYCEEFEGSPDYGTCHADCDAGANQCFAGAYNAYEYSGASYGARYSGLRPPPPWYGNYGAWYPNSGYVFSFSYFDNYGYGYNRPYRGRNRAYRRDRRAYRPRGQGGGQGANPPAQRPPQGAPPPRQPRMTPPPPQRGPSGNSGRSPRKKDSPKGDIE